MTYKEIIAALQSYAIKSQAILEAIEYMKKQHKAINSLAEQRDALNQQLHFAVEAEFCSYAKRKDD